MIVTITLFVCRRDASRQDQSGVDFHNIVYQLDLCLNYSTRTPTVLIGDVVFKT